MPTINEVNESAKNKSSKGYRAPAEPQEVAPQEVEPQEAQFNPEDMKGALLAPVLNTAGALVQQADEHFSQIERIAASAIAQRQSRFVSNVIGYAIEYSKAGSDNLNDSLNDVLGEFNAATFQIPEFTAAPFTRLAGRRSNRALSAEPTNSQPTNQPETQPTNQLPTN